MTTDVLAEDVLSRLGGPHADLGAVGLVLDVLDELQAAGLDDVVGEVLSRVIHWTGRRGQLLRIVEIPQRGEVLTLRPWPELTLRDLRDVAMLPGCSVAQRRERALTALAAWGF